MGSPIYNINNVQSNRIDINTGEILSLGTNAKSVQSTENASSASARRTQRYALQAIARKLLPKERVAQCQHRCGRGGVSIQYSPSSGYASYAGVVTCGSVWTCPVCSNRISNHRRKELNTLLSWSRKMGYQPLLMTLTARHGADDSLGDLLDAMKTAKKRFHNSRAWKSLQSTTVGHVTATEVTHGLNGWHVHFHMLIVADCPNEQVAMQRYDLSDAWLAALRPPRKYGSNTKTVKSWVPQEPSLIGLPMFPQAKQITSVPQAPLVNQPQPQKLVLTGNGYAFDLQDASHVEDYITKWGAGEELALSGVKDSRQGKGRTMWQLLDDAATDRHAASLFVEYTEEFHGRRQLVWSPGLKNILGILEKTDEQLSSEPEDEDYVEVARVPRNTWKLVLRRGLQAELLDVAESGGLDQAGHYVNMWVLALHNQERLRDGTTYIGQ